MNKKGLELTIGNIITVAIVVILVFVVMIIFGPKLLGLGKSGSDFFGLDVCPQTGFSMSEYDVMIQDFLVRGQYDYALDKYDEFVACFPKTKLRISQSQKDLLELHAVKRKYFAKGVYPDLHSALNRLAQSDNLFVSVEALYFKGKLYEAAKNKNEAAKDKNEAAKDKSRAQAVYRSIILRYSKITLPEVQLRVGYAQWYLADIDKAIAAYSTALRSSDISVKLSAADGLIGIAEEHAYFCKEYKQNMTQNAIEVWKEDGINAVTPVIEAFDEGTAKRSHANQVIGSLNQACK